MLIIYSLLIRHLADKVICLAPTPSYRTHMMAFRRDFDVKLFLKVSKAIEGDVRGFLSVLR